MYGELGSVVTFPLSAVDYLNLIVIPEQFPSAVVIGSQELPDVAQAVATARGLPEVDAARTRIVFNNGVMAAERDVLVTSTERYGALTVGGNYTKVADGLGVAASRVETPDAFVPALREAIETTAAGAPFLIECVTKEGYDFSRYP